MTNYILKDETEATSWFDENRGIQLLSVALLTVAALLMRLYKLGEWSLWIDEIWSIRDAQELALTPSIIAQKFHFLFYLSIKPVLQTLGISEWSARLTPALIGVVSIPILFFVIKKVFSARIALLSVFLLALSPWHLYWSQNVRFYTLLLLLYNLAFFSFYWGLKHDRFRYLLLATVLFVLAMVTHPTAMILIPVLAIYIVLLLVLRFPRPAGLTLKNLVPFLLLPVIYLLLEVIRLAGGGNLLAAGILELFVYGGTLDIAHSIRLSVGVVYYISIPVLCLAVAGGIYLIQQKKHEGLLLLIATFVPFLILLFPVSHTRYTFLALPMWLVLAAIAVDALFRQTSGTARTVVLGVTLILIATSISDTYLYYFYQNGQRWDWKGAFQTVEQNKEEEDLVVTTWIELGEYYLGDTVLPMNRMTPEEVMASGERIWFVDDGWVNPPLVRWLTKNAELIEVRDVHLPGKVYETRTYLYEPPSSTLSQP